MTRTLRALCLMICGFSLACVARAEPADDALRELQTFYRTQPSCERVRVEYRTPGAVAGAPQRVARSSVVVRLNPRLSLPTEPAGSGAEPATNSAAGVRSIALELPPLRVWIEGDRLIAIHERNSATYFESSVSRPLTSKAVGEAMPAVPMPQVDLASAAPGGTITEFWPYVRNIRWTSAEVDARQPRHRVLRGVGVSSPMRTTADNVAPAASVAVTLVMQGQRLHTLALDFTDLGSRLTLACTPLQPCDTDRSPTDLTRRTRVVGMDELQPKGGTLRVGVRVPALPLTEAAGKGWSIESLLQPPPRAVLAGVGPAEHVVLVFLRGLPDGAPRELSRFDPATLAKALGELRAESFRAPPAQPRDPAGNTPDLDPVLRLSRFAFAPVLVLTNPEPDEVLRRLRQADAEWGGGGSGVLWSTEPRSTIDLFAPGAEVAVIILDPELVLRGVIVPAKGETAEQVADRIAAALFELAP